MVPIFMRLRRELWTLGGRLSRSGMLFTFSSILNRTSVYIHLRILRKMPSHTKWWRRCKRPPSRSLAYRTFDKLRQVSQGAIVENKRLGAALAVIREQQIERAETRSMKAPRRRDQHDARLFKVG